MDEPDIRPLTREEQLQWYTNFIKEQLEIYQKELEVAMKELDEIQKPKQLTLEKKKES